MEQKTFISAINQICEEKNLTKEIVLETVEAALAAAYKKDYGDKDQEVRVELDENTGEPTVYVTKEVAEEIENPHLQITVEEAQKHKKGAKAGDTVELKDMPKDFGRVAAQTAKQVIIQRIREAERDLVFSEYKDKENDLINGTVQRVEGNNVFVDLGKAVAIMFPNDQIPGEKYYIGQRLKVFVVRVEQTTKGPQIVVSRTHAGVVRRLFELEVPEIESGAVEVKNIAREAGARTKVSCASNQAGVDPVGTLVGQRGTRVQAVMAELGEEKIDIILFSEDPKVYITNALAPTKVVKVEVSDADKKAVVTVPSDQLSLAIGKQGQNVRLAAKLTDWNIDIVSAEGEVEASAEPEKEAAKPKKPQDLEAEIISQIQSQDGPAETTPTAKEAVTGEKSENTEAVKVENEGALEENKSNESAGS